MVRYANNTQVSTDRSLMEIKKTLTRYGAEAFVFAESQKSAGVGFRFNGRPYRVDIPLPLRNEKRFTETSTGRERNDNQVLIEWEKGCRQVWRAAALWIKGSLEAVESGFVEAEVAFMPFLVLKGGATVAQKLLPDMDNLLAGSNVKALLSDGR